MKTTYYTLVGNALKKVGSVIKTSRGWVSNPTAEDCATMVDENGKPNPAYPRSEESFAPPKCDEGYRVVADGYDLVAVEDSGSGREEEIHSTPTPTNYTPKVWVRKWKVEPIQYTVADYDNAMEDYIHQVAVDRGYTRREPSGYKGDPYPRFAQDAEDFIAFRSSVMLYALPILNEYLATGNAPTLAEFKAGFPKMVWSYTEEM
jgi:hypothetical protein